MSQVDKKNAQFQVRGAEELMQQALEAVERVEKTKSQEDLDISALEEAFAAAAPSEVSAKVEKSSPQPEDVAELPEDVVEKLEGTTEALEQTTEQLEHKSEQLLQAEQQISALEAQVQRLEDALQRSEQSRQDIDQERQQHYDRLLRLSADFDNLRKRSSREKEEMKKFGPESVMRDLLDVLDNFDRAMESVADASDSVREGLEMVHRQLHDVMKRNGVSQFSSKGEPFDYTRHEALSVVESDEMPANFVFEEFQAGYMFHDRLLRASRVVVTKAPPAPAAEAEAVVEGQTDEEMEGQTNEEVEQVAAEPEVQATEDAAATETEGFDNNPVPEDHLKTTSED